MSVSEIYLDDLQEWERHSPEYEDRLCGLSLGDDSAVHDQVKRLSPKIEILELRKGLFIRTRSHVGRIKLGKIRITIRPKVRGIRLLRLLRYAYQLRDLQPAVGFATELDSFEDLLIGQLGREAEDLVSRGLHRKYIRVPEVLSIPRGRIDIQRIARRHEMHKAALPCIYYPRIENCLVNQVLLAGLHLGARVTESDSLRMELRRLATLLQANVSLIRLDQNALGRCHREMDRLTTAYLPSLNIIEILLQSKGISLKSGEPAVELPGFLFDMNLFFQELLHRFLKDNLEDYTVKYQHELKNVLTYVDGYNPTNRPSPVLIPDFAIMSKCKVVSLLDAKYRDIWELGLGEKWLYQLAVYALSQDRGGYSTILYPTVHNGAKEARIQINEPAIGPNRAQVVLRPVNLVKLDDLLCGPQTVIQQRRRGEYARQLAFGEELK